MQNNLRNIKGSSRWVLGPILLGGVLSIFGVHLARKYVLGCDGKGGEFLKLKTQYSMDDIQYNREFQKFRYTE